MELKEKELEKIDAIILAGGLGTRLRTIIDDRPKVMAPINDRPFLDIILNSLSQCNLIKCVVLAIGYMSEKIIEEYNSSGQYPFKIHFSIEKELLGTGGGIKKGLSQTTTEQVLVLNGDSFVEVDLYELIRSHHENGAGLTMTIVEVENASRFGRVVLGNDGRVISFLEKQSDAEAGYINAGVYILQRDLFNVVDADVPISLEHDLMPLFIMNKVYAFVTRGRFIDIGTPASYTSFLDYYLRRN
jgi:D-glycero-alpha-D-manno-heptose 1-phosphate guanylyltransferase